MADEGIRLLVATGGCGHGQFLLNILSALGFHFSTVIRFLVMLHARFTLL